jgi:hypothetical protein
LALCLLCGAPVHAQTIFVSNASGRDEFDGLTPEPFGTRSGPVATIQRALQLVGRGGRIVIENTGRPYRETLSLSGPNHRGDGVRNFEIIGNGAVLDGSFPIPPEGWRYYAEGIYRFRPQRLDACMLFLDGQPARRVPVAPLSRELPPLQPLEWCYLEPHVYFRVEPGRRPEDYALSHAVLSTGITLYHAADVVIVDLTVQGFRLDGVNVNDGVQRCTLGGLVCRGNGRAGIAIAGSSRVECVNCLVGNNAQAQVLTQGHIRAVLRNCDLIDDPLAPALVRRDEGELHVVEDAPVAPASGNSAP